MLEISLKNIIFAITSHSNIIELKLELKLECLCMRSHQLWSLLKLFQIQTLKNMCKMAFVSFSIYLECVQKSTTNRCSNHFCKSEAFMMHDVKPRFISELLQKKWNEICILMENFHFIQWNLFAHWASDAYLDYIALVRNDVSKFF